MVLPPQLHASMRKLAIDTYIGPTMLSEAIRRRSTARPGASSPAWPACRPALRERRDALVAAIDAHLGDRVVVRRARRRLLPVGDAAGRRRRRAWPTPPDAAGVPVVKGSTCFTDGRGRDALRLAYSACPAGRHGRGRGASRSPAVGSGFSSRRTTYGEVVPSNPPDDSRQSDELQELLTLLGAAAQLAGCWLYIEDRFARRHGAVRRTTRPASVPCSAIPELAEVVWRDHVAGRGRGDPGRAGGGRAGRLRSTSATACAASTASCAWCATAAACSATAAGAVRVFGTVQDVTDEQEIRETVRRIGETIDEYYFTDELRPDGTYEPIFATSAIDRLLGGIPEGMTYGEAWHAAVHPDDRALAGVAGRAAAGRRAGRRRVPHGRLRRRHALGLGALRGARDARRRHAASSTASPRT